MIFHIAFYLHLGPFAQFVIKRLESEMDELERQPLTWATAHTSEPQLAAAAAS
jgi:hypothetical protein